MIPYYDDGWCAIYHGDCREFLPWARADSILTDFPYGVGLDYGQTFEDSPGYLDALIADCLPLMRRAAPTVALTCGVVNQWRYPRPNWVLCWHQNNSPTARVSWGFNQWQPVLCYGKDPYLARGMGGRPDVISVGASGRELSWLRDAGHPCPKPLDAWKRILCRVSARYDDEILDPFMGSGTTLRAAKELGRHAIGVEIEEKYCEIAAKRLTQEVLPLGV